MIYSHAPESAAAQARAAAGPPAPEPVYRILERRRTRPSEVQRLPQLARLLELGLDVIDYPGTYALAEEIATATLIESVAVRFWLPGRVRGAAIWRDWRWSGALRSSGGGAITLEHLEALVTGAPWPPPAVTCPRCAAEVRKNADGSPRAHGRKRRCRGYWVSLMDRSWGLPIRPDERIAG